VGDPIDCGALIGIIVVEDGIVPNVEMNILTAYLKQKDDPGVRLEAQRCPGLEQDTGVLEGQIRDEEVGGEDADDDPLRDNLGRSRGIICPARSSEWPQGFTDTIGADPRGSDNLLEYRPRAVAVALAERHGHESLVLVGFNLPGQGVVPVPAIDAVGVHRTLDFFVSRSGMSS
jgi:hypothetical protein